MLYFVRFLFWVLSSFNWVVETVVSGGGETDSVAFPDEILLAAMPDAMFVVNRDGVVLGSEAVADLSCRVATEAVLKKNLREILPQDIAQQCLLHIGRALQSGQLQVFQYQLPVAGGFRDFESRLVAIQSVAPLAIVRDITPERSSARQLRKERDFISTVLDTAAALVVVLDRAGRIVRTNRACELTTRYSFDEMRNRKIWELFSPPEETEHNRSVFESLLASGTHREHENCWISKDGTRHFITWSSSAVTNDDGLVEHVVCTGIDITHRKKAEEQIHFLAYYDDLTRLPNRVLFKELLNQALAFSERYRRQLAVIFLDLNRFKEINDVLGSTQGDALLRAVADRLSRTLRRSDSVSRFARNEPVPSVSRFGGDEFTVLVTDIENPRRAAIVARRLLRALKAPFRLDGCEISVTASIGISIYGFDGASADTLLRNAETAMYHCKKESTGNEHVFYSSSMTVHSVERLSLESDLRQAIQKNELILFYQPKLEVRTGQVVGAEALARWQHPTKGLLPPSEFMNLAEETGLVLEIEEWSLAAACRQNKSWQERGLSEIPVSINPLSSTWPTTRTIRR